MKRFYTLVFTSVLLISSMSVFCFPALAATSGRTGDCTWTLEGTILTIRGNGAMEDFFDEYSVSPWGTSITELRIEEGVTKIGDYAFYNDDKLTSVTISNSVTKIGDNAFCNCDKLTSIIIPNSVTTIGLYAFGNCDDLKIVTFNATKCTYMTASFGGCTNLTTINIGEEVTMIFSRAFVDCPNLREVNFYATNCNSTPCFNKTNLEVVNIGENVTKIPHAAFEGCTSLNTIIIPDSVTYIGDTAFMNTGIYNNTENWQNGAFYLGKHLVEVENSVSGNFVIKDGIKYIAQGAFKDNIGLTSVTVPKSLVSINGAAFNNCGLLTDVYYEGTKEEWDRVFIGEQNEAFLRAEIHCVEPKTDTGTEADAMWSLYDVLRLILYVVLILLVIILCIRWGIPLIRK